MKKLLFSLFVLALIANKTFAQAPQSMNYQAIARDASGSLLINQHIGIRITITNGNGGSTLYQESDTTTTNQFGLFTLSIGNGTPLVGLFSTIPWATVTPWLEVEMDPVGGTVYQYMGSSQLLSVPYALYAASGNQGPPGIDGDRYSTTSSTSMTINTGVQNFTVSVGLNYSIGQTIIIANSVSNLMTGTVVSYNANTGDMVANVSSVTGSGNFSSWSVALNGAPGPAGPAGVVPSGTAAGNTIYWDGTNWIVNSSNLYNNGGNIGINTNTPAGKLHIKGSSDVSQLYIDANSVQSNSKPLVRLRNSSGTDLMHIHSDDPANIFVGLSAGRVNSTGSFNSFVGSLAGYSNTIGSDNTALGRHSLYSNVSGSDNTAMGYLSLNSNTDGNNNTAAGSFALTSNISGSENCAFGVNALSSNTYGYGNTAGGSNALYTNTSGVLNTAFGFQSLSSNTTGDDNTAFGSDALLQNSIGYNNTAVGRLALKSNNDGYNNSALGSSSLFSNTGGDNNTAIGRHSLYSNTSGSNNSAMGHRSLYANLTGFDNTALGDSTLANNTFGFQNTAGRNGSLISNTSGFSNTSYGVYSLRNNTVGFLNTAIGDSALYLNNNGFFNTGIGFLADVSTGGLINSTALGANAIVNDTNKIRIGDVNITEIEGQVAFSIPSDGRFKYNVSEKDIKGLDFIKRLRPVEYNFDTRKFEKFLSQDMPGGMRDSYESLRDFEASSSIRQSGFIAQDVEKAMKESGYDFNGLHSPKNGKDHYSVSYSLFVVPLVKAVQEQQSQIEELKKLNDSLQKENLSIKADIVEIKAQLGSEIQGRK